MKDKDIEREFEETDEAIPEEMELEEEELMGAAKQKKLREKLAQCEKEKMAALEDLQRAKADFLNSKRRLDEQLRSDRDRLAVRHVEELLPLADSFEMSRAHSAWENADAAWQKGIEQIHAQLKSILARYGVERIGEAGEPFDPARHEAVTSEPVTDKAMHHTVTKVLQSGYTMNGSVIRAARVAVGEYTE